MSTHDDDYMKSVMDGGPEDDQHDDAEDYDPHFSGRSDSLGAAESQRIAPGEQDSLRPHSAPVPATAAAERGVSPEVQQARDAREPDDLPDGPERTVFTHSPATRAVWHAARARRAGPWATLGYVMAMTVAATSPYVQLPPLVGGNASLNMLIGLVARSGGGKGKVRAVARGLFRYCHHNGNEVHTPLKDLGTGEGIAELFTRRESKDQDIGPESDTSPPESTAVTRDQGSGTPDRALFDDSEIQAVAQRMGRQGATLMPMLCKFWSGESLGNLNASAHTSREVPEHSYRGCLTVAIQPANSGVILGDLNSGTPQRWLWLPTTDYGRPDIQPTDPAIHKIHLPREATGPNGTVLMGAPDDVAREVDRQARDQLAGKIGPDLDSHRTLSCEKVAAALALMGGRMTISVNDWHAAKVVMDVSDDTRRECQSAVDRAAEDAVAERERTREAGQQQLENDRIDRAREVIETALNAGAGRFHRSEVRNSKARRFRFEFDDILSEMTEARAVTIVTDQETGAQYVVDIRQ